MCTIGGTFKKDITTTGKRTYLPNYRRRRCTIIHRVFKVVSYVSL